MPGTQEDQAKRSVCPGFAALHNRKATAPPSVMFAAGRVVEARCDGESVGNPAILDPIGGWNLMAVFELAAPGTITLGRGIPREQLAHVNRWE